MGDAGLGAVADACNVPPGGRNIQLRGTGRCKMVVVVGPMFA